MPSIGGTHRSCWCPTSTWSSSRARLEALEGDLVAHPGAALTGALLSNTRGRPVFSRGAIDRPLNELLRSAGLRQGRFHAAARVLLRALPAWQQRNTARGVHGAPGDAVLPDHQYVPWTCLAVRTDAWRDVGPLDERFFLYGEDIDWCVRAHAAGYALRVVDAGQVVHHERATASPVTDAHYEASHLKLHDKWGWTRQGRWQRVGLRARRTVLRRLTAPIDWPTFDREAEL